MSSNQSPPATSGGHFTVQRMRHDRTATVMVSGELDVQTGAALRAALGEELNHPEVGRVIADLTSVSFMSSTGIAVLVDADDEARRQRRQLHVVVGEVHAVCHPLRITGVDRILSLYFDADTPLTIHPATPNPRSATP